jgi:Helix-turn-helix domain
MVPRSDERERWENGCGASLSSAADSRFSREIGLFRYALIRDAADAGLSKRERGRLVRAIADREHVGPDGRLVRVSRTTLGRWIRAYRHGGFEALVPQPRVVPLRTPAGMLELAFASMPSRSATTPLLTVASRSRPTTRS